MFDWNQIDTVMLDMDGTLLDLHFDNYFWLHFVPDQYAKHHGLKLEQAKDEIFPIMQAHQGTLNWYSLDFWSEQLNLNIPRLKEEINHMIEIRPHVIDFLSALRDSGKTIALVTNAHRKTLEIKMRCTQIDTWFDHLIVSHELDFPKEDPRFWQALRIVLPHRPERTLFVDDTDSVLQAAHRSGIGFLLTLLQPDSKKTPRTKTNFPAIMHFDELLPDLNTYILQATKNIGSK